MISGLVFVDSKRGSTTQKLPLDLQDLGGSDTFGYRFFYASKASQPRAFKGILVFARVIR